MKRLFIGLAALAACLGLAGCANAPIADQAAAGASAVAASSSAPVPANLLAGPIASPIPDATLAKVPVLAEATNTGNSEAGVTLNPVQAGDMAAVPTSALSALKLCNLTMNGGGAFCASTVPSRITLARLTDNRELDYQAPYVNALAWVIEWDGQPCGASNGPPPANAGQAAAEASMTPLTQMHSCVLHTLVNASTGKYISAWSD